MKYNRLVWFIMCLSVSLTACQSSQIYTYKVPKEPIPLASLADDSADDSLHWHFPSHWVATETNSFRQYSFRVPHPSMAHPDAQGDFSIVSFPGTAGSILSNVNRWRGQLSLPPISEEELDFQLLNEDNRRIKVFDMTSTTSHPEAGFYPRTLVATFQHNDQQYFIKLTGESMLLNQEKSHFLGLFKDTYHD